MLRNQSSVQGYEWRETENLVLPAQASQGLGERVVTMAVQQWGAGQGGGVRLGQWASGQEITKGQGEHP